MRGAALVAAVAVLLTGSAAGAAPLSAAHALRTYYRTLKAELPVAPPGAILAPDRPVTRIAFGSCDQQDRPQHVWNVIAAQQPDLFLMVGDNVYGDIKPSGAADLPALRAAYSRLAEHQAFRDFRAQVPMRTTWDDHDFGQNDGGGTFAFKEYAEKVYEHFWNAGPDVLGRPGVYSSQMIGAPGQRVQIILLDTRFFRTDLQYQPWSPQPAPLGTAQPDDSEQATMLGADQWRWLDQQLAAPADLRIIVSSIQVLTDAHRFESWSLFPRERQRLLGLIKHHDIQNAVLLSGDRHQGGLYREKPQQGLYELTSSSLNLSFANPAKPWIEPDPSRIGNLYAGENFGTVEIDWAKGDVSLMLRDAATGEAVMRQDIPALIRRAR